MARKFELPELPEQFQSNELDTDIPPGVYYNPGTGGLVIQDRVAGFPITYELPEGHVPKEIMPEVQEALAIHTSAGIRILT